MFSSLSGEESGAGILYIKDNSGIVRKHGGSSGFSDISKMPTGQSRSISTRYVPTFLKDRVQPFAFLSLYIFSTSSPLDKNVTSGVNFSKFSTITSEGHFIFISAVFPTGNANASQLLVSTDLFAVFFYTKGAHTVRSFSYSIIL
jgi:hypothetical protein